MSQKVFPFHFMNKRMKYCFLVSRYIEYQKIFDCLFYNFDKQLCLFYICVSFLLGKNLKNLLFFVLGLFMIINDCGLRGGNYNNNTNAGVFNFNPSTNAIGGANNNNSFRLVMGTMI